MVRGILVGLPFGIGAAQPAVLPQEDLPHQGLEGVLIGGFHGPGRSSMSWILFRGKAVMVSVSGYFQSPG